MPIKQIGKEIYFEKIEFIRTSKLSFQQHFICARNPDALHPDGYATEKDPSYCYANSTHFQSGIQDWKLHSTDYFADFKIQPDGGTWGKGTIGQVLNANKGQKVSLSIGGWSLSAAIRQAIKPEHRAQFIASIIDFLDPNSKYPVAKPEWNKTTFSGVDIDWEPNGNMWTLPNAGSTFVQVSKEDLINYKDFLSDLKSALSAAKAKGIVSNDNLRIAVTANPTVIENVDQTYGSNYWLELSQIVSSIDSMTYDYHGPFDDTGCTGFNSPLFNDPRAEQCKFNPRFSIQGTIDAFEQAHVPQEKIIVGLPAYGRAYVVTEGKAYVPFSYGYSGPTGDSIITNRTIYTGLYNGASTGLNFLPNMTSDDIGQNSSWSFLPGSDTQKVFITFDDSKTAAAKMQYISGKMPQYFNGSLQGMMVWSLDGDVRPGDATDNQKNGVIAGLAQGR